MKVLGKMATVILMASILATTTVHAVDAISRPADGTLDLLRITPDGTDVPAGRQVVFTFDRPVVPVGRMERSAEEIPITITPALNCRWRWLNTSSLACELGDKDGLRPATEYHVSVASGLTADDGAVMTKTLAHHFITQRPKITRTRFRQWRAPGWPLIQVTFDQPVSRASVLSRMAFKTAKTGRSAALTAEPDKDDRETPLFLPLPGEKLALTGAASSPRQVDDQANRGDGNQARRIWVLAPAAELPLDSAVSLSVTPGLVSALGPMTGVEHRTVVEFSTYPEFRFLGVRCQDARTHQPTLIAPRFSSTEPFTAEAMAQCAPLDSVALAFSAPVINEEVKSHITITPELAGGRTDYDPWENRYSYSHLSSPHREGATYTVWLPERLKAYQRYTLQSDAANFRDEFGRVLKAPVDMAFMTAHRDPALVLDHNKAVLEKRIDSDVPVYVTNLETLTVSHRILTAKSVADVTTSTRTLPPVEDVAYAVPLGVRELLGSASGVVTGHIGSDPQPPDYRPGDYRFFAEITPFQVNVKLGHFNSLVWVTDLATGAPVAGAGVSVFLDDYVPDPVPSVLAACRTDDSGICTLPGIETLDPKLSYVSYVYDDDQPRLVVRVDKAQDLALVYLDYHFMTWAGGVNANTRVKNGHLRAWGTTAQGVYKLGDIIQYKLYVRNHDNRRWVAPRRSGYTLSIVDPKGQAVQKVENLTLSSFGAYAGEFALPGQAAVGWYQFQLEYGGLPAALPVMRVLVSDFTPAPFRVTTELSGDRFEPGDVIEITSLAKMHAGGPYSNADTRVTVRLVQRVFQPKTAPAKDFRFDSGEYRNRPTWDLHESSAEGNDTGEVTTQVTLADKAIVYGRLTVESAVRDERGKYIAAAAGADYIGRDRFVGLRSTRWAYDEGAPAAIEYLTVDVDGTPVAGLPVAIRVERRETKASRVKGAGNAYLTNYVTSWVAAGTWKGASASQPATYTFTPQHAGEYRITASVQDTRNRRHDTTIHAWVVGKGRVVWEGPDSNALKVIADKDSYQVGDTARFLVQNPLPGAMALVTVERYGVLKHWVQLLNGSTPVIDVPVEEDFLPGFYLSVLVTSPRVDAPPVEGNVDLGKPTFRLGYVPVRVTDTAKEIAVAVSADRETYKPGDTVHARIRALPRRGAGGAPIELAVVVIDEAVFDLNSKGRSYYDPYEGFNSLDGLDLNNYTLLSLLVGRQQFEKKGASPGGGGAAGGGPRLRSLFKYVSYWNPSLIADQDGHAAFSFTVPDNLTGWRIFAMAVTPDDRMGLGDAGFKVNRPTELRPVMPNQVSEGDIFTAGFSVMNRTDRERTLSVTISGKGAPETVAAVMDKTAQIHLAPFKRETVWLPIETKGFGDIRFTASAGDALDTDAVAHTVPVLKRRSLVTAATHGTTLETTTTDRIAFPEGIYPDVGGISVVTSPSVIGNIDGAFRYLRDYRYGCWEQQLTKGVMAAHYQNLKAYMPVDFTWPGSAALPQAVLDAAAGFQAPGGGMVYWVPEDAYVSPYLSAYTALAFNWLSSSGCRVPRPVEEKLHAYLTQLLRREVMPSFYTQGMASSVRAVALAALAGHGKVSFEDLNRYRPHLGEMDLFGKAHFLMAAMAVDGGRAIADEAARLILSHASQSGGKVQFNEVLDDSYSYILATPLRSNAAILAALLKVSVDPGGRALVGDIPFKLVRAITQARGNRDHWQNTQENIFCLNALTAFARAYETESPDMTVSAFLGDRKLGEVRFTDLRDDAVTFTDPMRRASPGLETEVTLKKQGAGRLYYATRMQYAPTEDTAARINAGIDIRREYAAQRGGRWELLSSPMAIRRGELVRVTLYVSLPTLRHYVVVDDPVPGGLEPVSRDLATASAVDAEKGDFTAAKDSWWFTYSDWSYYGRFGYSFYHQELRHAAARFFADYLPAGNYVLSYTAQAIASGRFSVMPVHAEEMYDPDVFGKGLPATLVVD